MRARNSGDTRTGKMGSRVPFVIGRPLPLVFFGATIIDPVTFLVLQK